MNPGKGVIPTRRATSLLFIFLHLTKAENFEAEHSNEANGDVGCLFSDIVCKSDEVCFNDLVIGRCISASSDNQHVERLGPLEGPSLGLLEAEMSRVFGLGFSWPDKYTQCVFQTLISSIQHRQPYSRELCGNYITAQKLVPQDNLDQDEDDNDQEGDDKLEDVFLVPEDDDDNEDDDTQQQTYIMRPDDFDARPDTPLMIVEDGDDEMTDLEQQEAWLQLQNVLHKMKEPQASELVIVPDEEDLLDDDFDNDDQIILVPLDDGSFNPLGETDRQIPLLQVPMQTDMDMIDPDSFYNYNTDNLLPYYPQPYIINVPDIEDKSNDIYHPIEKREANYNQALEDENEDDFMDDHAIPYAYLVEPYDAEVMMEPETSYAVPEYGYETLYQPPNFYYDIPDNEEYPKLTDDDVDIKNFNQERTNLRQRRNNDKDTIMDTIYPDTVDDDDLDFEYIDSKESRDGDDDDILYYNPDNEPIEVESVFNRRERLDVKKPGPFYANSPNNFYIDKLPEDVDDVDLDDDLGQTEYEYPMSQEEPRHKKGYDQPLLSFSEPPQQKQDFLYVNIKDRFSSLGQANKLWQYVADHLELPKEVFSDFKPETSRIVLKVNSNPRQLNATSMAKILESDNTLREHAKNDLGLEIDNFEVGDEKSTVMSVYSGPSQLFLLMFLLTAGIAALLLAAAVLLFIRRRSQDKTKKIQEEAKIEREEPVKEYKQLVRDWSRSSRASQGSETHNNQSGVNPGSESQINQSGAGSHQSKGSAQNKILGKTGQNSEGSRTSSTSSWQEDPSANCMDISTGHMVLSYMEDHLNNKQRLEQEWVGLCAYEAEPNSTSIAFKVENKKKNKYPDKLPYDHNRVLLNALVNGSNSDYINASSVMDHDPRNPAYIITQGPMSHTVADFWQMVWEQGSVVIVMLSRLSENSHQLCHRYWPEEGSEQYHIFEVHLVSEHVWCDDYLVRSLYLKNSQTGETRTVTQFHFLSWPDGSIPSSTKAILEFRRKVNKSYRGRSCPMIVHCSDGVGRSGTYVLIDMVLNRMMKGSKEIDIAATLEHIRDQRAGMVQTRSQFEFCLSAVAEETHAILKALPQ